MAFQVVTVFPLSASTPVSTLTPLLAFKDFGQGYSTILFELVNNDGANAAYLDIESSTDGTTPDADLVERVAPASKGCSYAVGPDNIRRYWRVSAHSLSPGYPTVNVQWKISGIPR